MSDITPEEHLTSVLGPVADGIAAEFADRIIAGQLSLGEALAQCDLEKTSEGADFQTGMKWELVKQRVVRLATS